MLNMMQIHTELDNDHADKLAYIQQQTQQDVDALISTAIDYYYQKLQGMTRSPLEVLTETGFIGCGSAEPDLSVNYKAVLQAEFQSKYDHR
jgi:hypothetical protein